MTAFRDLWPNGPAQAPVPSNGTWVAQFDYVADPTADALPQLDPSSSTLFDFDISQIASAWNQQVFARDLAGNAINGPNALHVHPAWAMDKTFIAPVAGWYHLGADGVRIFGSVCGADQTGDGALLEVYAVRANGVGWTTERLWASLITGRNCDAAIISLDERLEAGDRLVVRGGPQSPNNGNDGIEVDPYVIALGSPDRADYESRCQIALAPAAPHTDRTADINDAIARAALLSGTCPSAEVALSPGDYTISGPIGFGAQTLHVSLRGDLGGSRARLLMKDRRAQFLNLDGIANEVRGVVFDYDTDSNGLSLLPFTQGTIQQLDVTSSTQGYVHVAIDPGFDSNFGDSFWANSAVGDVQGVFTASPARIAEARRILGGIGAESGSGPRIELDIESAPDSIDASSAREDE